MGGNISSNKLTNNTNLFSTTNKVINYSSEDKKHFLIWDFTRMEAVVLEELLHNVNYHTGQILISKTGLAKKVGCSRKTVTRFFQKCAKLKIVDRGKQRLKKNGDWGYCEDTLRLDNFSVGHFGFHTLTNVNNISNITKEEIHFEKKPGDGITKKRDVMPTNEKEEKELIENFKYYPANKKRLDTLGWEKSLQIKKAFKEYIRRTPIPEYLQKLLNTILWTEEAINVYFPTWLKKTLDMQKKYGNKFIPYHVRQDYKYARDNNLIRYESKDDKNSHIKIRNSRLRDYRSDKIENNFCFKSKVLKPSITNASIKRMTDKEFFNTIDEKGCEYFFDLTAEEKNTLTMLEEIGIDNFWKTGNENVT